MIRTRMLVAVLLGTLLFVPSAFADSYYNTDCFETDAWGRQIPCQPDGEETGKWWEFWKKDGGGTVQECPSKGETCKSCAEHCACQYQKNRDECGSSATCLDLASAEKNACDGGCMNDYVCSEDDFTPVP